MKLFSFGQGARTPAKKRMIKWGIALGVLVFLSGVGVAVWHSLVAPPDPIKHSTQTPAYTSTPNQGDAPAQEGDRIADYFTFLVGAVDQDETRTDALMVCGFDTKKKTLHILNIPRDTMSDVPRRGASKKINAAYGTKKGIEETKAEIKKLIGFAPDYYMIMNFKGIADIVDAIGGVEYDVPFRMYYKDPSQNLSIDFKKGMTHMNGKEVVEFLRWRKNNHGVKTGDPHYTGSDEERIVKQQEFLKYLASQVLRPGNLMNMQKISKAVFDNVKTDLTAGNLLWMAMQANGMDQSQIKMHTLPGEFAYSYAGTSWCGSFFFPNEKEVLELINSYFNPYTNRLADLDIVPGPDKSSHKGEKSDQHEKKTSKHDKPQTQEPAENEDPEQAESAPKNDTSEKKSPKTKDDNKKTERPKEEKPVTPKPEESTEHPEITTDPPPAGHTPAPSTPTPVTDPENG